MSKLVLTIREGVEQDVATIVEFGAAMAMETESLKLDPVESREAAEGIVRDAARGRYYLAEVEGDVVGQLMVRQEWMPERNAFAWWIQSVYVKPKYRRRGYYRRLYEQVRHMATEQGVAALRLYADRENAPARAAYSRLGMKETGPVYECEVSSPR